MGIKDRVGQKNRLFVWGILLLLIVVAGLGYLNYSNATSGGARLQEGKITVAAEGVTIKVLTVDELRKLPAVQKRMVIHSAGGTMRHDFTGTSLLAVLNSIDPGLTRKYNKIISRGADNYTSVIGMPEVLLPDNVYLVYEDFGKPLPTIRGEDGAVQVIICSDEFGQRFTNWLVRLELEH